MDAFAGQGVEVDRQGRDQGLAFAGLHFRDLAPVQNNAAQHLYVEMAQAKGAFGGFAHGGEGFDHDVVDAFPRLKSLSEGGGAGLERVVGQLLEFRFKAVDGIDVLLQAVQVPVIGGTEQALGDGAEHSGVVLEWVNEYDKYEAIVAVPGRNRWGRDRGAPRSCQCGLPHEVLEITLTFK